VPGAEIAALGWLASFLNNVLGDRLKKRPSGERARERAFALYEALAHLRSESAAFVEALGGAANDGVGASESLKSALREVSSALEDLSRALHAVDPQLEVHMPEVAEEVLRAQRSRAAVITQVDVSLAALARGEEAKDLDAVVADAERALAQIELATEDVRAFLADEFSFKESF
jgi:hypothetical protein